MATRVVTTGSYSTVGGKHVARVLMIDRESSMPCIGVVSLGGQWTPMRWSEGGEIFPGLTEEHSLNLDERLGDVPIER